MGTKQGRKQNKETLKNVSVRPGRQKKNLRLTKRHTTKRAESRKKLPIKLLGSKLSKRKQRRDERKKKRKTKQGRKQNKETLKNVSVRPGRQKKNLRLTKRHT